MKNKKPGGMEKGWQETTEIHTEEAEREEEKVGREFNLGGRRSEDERVRMWRWVVQCDEEW